MSSGSSSRGQRTPGNPISHVTDSHIVATNGSVLGAQGVSGITSPQDSRTDFSLNGTSIHGGTFNSVRGNMTQVFNSQAVVAGVSVQAGGTLTYHRDPQSGPICSTRVPPTLASPYARPRLGLENSTANVALQSSHQELNLLEDESNAEIGQQSLIPYNEIPSYLSHRTNTLHTFPASTARPTRLLQPLPEPQDPHATRTSGNISNTVGGNMTQIHLTSHGNSGLDILYRNIAMSAVHDSAERFPEPACHPGTRTQVLEDLRSWLCDTSSGSPLMWLYGCAGMGKSAVAQAFAGECATAGQLGASFFFKRGHHERGTWNRLFTTVAYQLATTVPTLSLHIQEAVEMDGLLVGRAMEHQFQKLIVEPLMQIPHPETAPILILDGLDECDDQQVQCKILHLILNAIHKQQLPLCVLIVSRPEPLIQETLLRQDKCQAYHLRADATSEDDIRQYLQAKFENICADFRLRGVDLTAGTCWPTKIDLESLVTRSCGTFIYAKTVIHYISDQYAHPHTQLAAVLSLNPESTAPLDELYTQILSALPQQPQQLRILHAVVDIKGISPEDIDLLLGLPGGTTRLALRALQSVVDVPTPYFPGGGPDEIQIAHTSFRDYLEDNRRSRGWCVAQRWLENDCFNYVASFLCHPRPRLTKSLQRLYESLVLFLPRCLLSVAPDNAIFDVLRNPNLQDNLLVYPIGWYTFIYSPKCSLYPTDLTQFWRDLDFIQRLGNELDKRKQPSRARSDDAQTLEFDRIYSEIFAASADLLFVLSSTVLIQHYKNFFFWTILHLYGMTHSVFTPFLPFCTQLVLPFPIGNSPLDFLEDPNRAGRLYLNREQLAETLILQWIQVVRKFLERGDFDVPWDMLRLIRRCPPSPRLLLELKTLDLSRFCQVVVADPDPEARFHGAFHMYYIRTEHFDAVLEWLETFPEPQHEVAELWRNQWLAIQECADVHSLSSASFDEEGDNSSDEEGIEDDSSDEEGE